EYMAQDLGHDSYVLTLTPQGALMEAWMYPGVRLEGDAVSTPYEVMDRYEQLYGNTFDWTPDTWVAFHAALEKAAATHGATEMLAYLAHQQYGLPDAASMTKDKAVDQAKAVLIREGGVRADEIQETIPPSAVYLMDGDTPVWKVRIFVNNGSHLVELDAHSGELRNIAVLTLSDRWYRSVVLESVYKANLSGDAIEPGTLVASSDTSYQWALENVKSNKAPNAWGCKAAPAFFWQEMEALGFGADTAEALVAEWIDAYGADMRFWPLSQRAIIHLWAYGLEWGTMTIYGLPAEGDIQQAQAEAIAWKAYRPLYEQQYGQEMLDAFVLSVRFAYNLYNRDDRVWTMEVIDPTRATGQGCGNVSIDAQTGEVLFVNAEIGGNGEYEWKI
ncbi:MAG TPA: PepSY domain-containing protein, partial [Clostridia bacterium]|nr:PepSY domain-containing protein [Clostridia bacterium]